MTYNINDLENLTGIKAHTIRIWEKRHKILNPSRTDSNIRSYNEKELKRFLMISILYNNNIKISEIAEYSDEITQTVNELLLEEYQEYGKYYEDFFVLKDQYMEAY